MDKSPVQILIVEDNPADAELTVHAFGSSKLENCLHVVEDGEAALDFLYRRGDYVDAPRPDLILLDLNLPGVDGREVLAQVKSDDAYKDIPVVVLTTSTADADVRSAYREHANAFMNKPIRFEDFAKVVRSLEVYWFSVVRLPQTRIEPLR